MKIAVTADGKDLDSRVDPRFGRCPYFIVVETDNMEFEGFENPNLALGGGAGIQSSQFVVERGVSAVLTGNCGPNAHQVMSAAGVDVIVGVTGTVREAVERFRSGELISSLSPNVGSHFGMERGGSESPEGVSGSSRRTMGPESGLGAGSGLGGRGGRGGIMGGGRGMGGGAGRGMGRGMGMGFSDEGERRESERNVTGKPSRSEEEIESLSAEKREIENRLRSIEEKLDHLKRNKAPGSMVAFVDENACVGCALCETVCPEGAVTVNAVARVDQNLCTGCGQCVRQCPQGAISLKKRR